MDENEQVKQTVQRIFGQNADKYVSSSTHAQGDDLALIVEWLQPEREWTVLDVATGGGHTAKKLAPYVSLVFATDLTRDMLAAAERHVRQECTNTWFVVADAEQLPFLDASFEAVTCRIAAHHFPDPAQFIKEAARVLKEGGKLVLIDNVVPDDLLTDTFVNRLEVLRDESHVRCCRISEWRSWLQEAGLQVLQERVRKKSFDFPVWVRRTASSEEQVKLVEEHIRNADTDLQAYIGLVTDEDRILSIYIDEWMVVAEKMKE